MPQTGSLIKTEIYFIQFWRLKVKDQGANIRFWCRTSSWFMVGALSLYPHVVGGPGSLVGSLIRALIPLTRAPPSSWKHLLKAHFLTPSNQALGLEHMNSGEHQHPDDNSGHHSLRCTWPSPAQVGARLSSPGRSHI